ncbi:MAG: hypothetical protein QM758_21575 [Armatimonas sp.]
MRRLLTLAVLLGASMALAAPAAYDVFPETRSPDGRFAVAWGVPGKTIDSARLRADGGDNEYADQVLNDAEKAQNYLIDLKKKSIVAPLSGFKGFFKENNGGVSARWSKKDPVALVTHHGKWEPRALSLINTAGVQKPLLEKLRNDIRDYLRPKGGKKYARVKEQLAFEVNDATFLPGKLTLTVTASVPKEEEGYSATVWAVYRFRARNGQLRIVDSHILPQGAKK